MKRLLLAAALLAGCKGEKPAPPVPETPVQAEVREASPEEQAAIEQAVEQAAAGWTFTGLVVDRLRQTPIADAEVAFASTGGIVRAKTDFSGRYSVDLPPLENGSYDPMLRAAGYMPHAYDGTGAELPLERRLLDRNGVPSREMGRFKGQTGAMTTFDFSLQPVQLTPAEQEQYQQALRRVSGGQ